MAPNFEYYKVFYYVAKYQNFTLAAKALMTSQPSVTRSIKSLEHNLGCRLFVRSTRGVTLTPEGELLYSHIASACDAIFEGEEALGNALNLQSGPVYVGCTAIAIYCFLLEKLEEYHNRFPQIAIKITNSSTPSLITDLKAGKIDLAIVTTPLEEEKFLKITKVKLFENILIAGPNFAHLRDQELCLADLTAYPLVYLSEETTTNKFYSDYCAEHGVLLKPSIELASADLLLPMITKNLGIGFIPADLAKPALERGEVFQLNLKEEIPHRYICVVRDTQHPLSPSTRQFIKLLQPEPQNLTAS